MTLHPGDFVRYKPAADPSPGAALHPLVGHLGVVCGAAVVGKDPTLVLVFFDTQTVEWLPARDLVLMAASPVEEER